MVDSESVGIGGEVASWLADVVVVDESGGDGEQPERDTDADSCDGAAAVAFERELALAGPEHGLDPLADGTERAGAAIFITAVGAQKAGAEAGQMLLELLAGEALVGDYGVALQRDAFEHLGRDLAFRDVGWRQLEGDRHAVGCAQQIEPEAPEVAAVAAAEAVGGRAGQFRTAARFRAIGRTAPAWSPAAADRHRTNAS
jgi:hypothetical protein